MREHDLIDCTGDVCVGDIIYFTEYEWGGSYRKPIKLGKRKNKAKILNDSYGSKKQQHTFTIQILESIGYKPLEVGKKTTRKGRNIYRNGTQRELWENENERRLQLEEKHDRGNMARIKRVKRRKLEMKQNLFNSLP